MLALARELLEQQQATVAQQQAKLAEKDFRMTVLTQKLASLRGIRYGKAAKCSPASSVPCLLFNMRKRLF